MKDTYIRFRCTTEMKEMIEAAAMHAGENVSEYILGVLMDDVKCLHEASFEAVLYKHGREIVRKNIGTYLLDEHDRAQRDDDQQGDDDDVHRVQNIRQDSDMPA